MSRIAFFIDFIVCVILFTAFELNIHYPSSKPISWSTAVCICIGILAGRAFARMSYQYTEE